MNDYVNLGILNWNMLNRKVVCLGTGTHHILTEWHFWPPSFVRGWRTEGTFGTTKKSDFWPPRSVGNEMAFLFTLNKGYTHNFDPIDSCSNYISVEISLQVFTNRAFKILNIFFTCSKSTVDTPKYFLCFVSSKYIQNYLIQKEFFFLRTSSSYSGLLHFC